MGLLGHTQSNIATMTAVVSGAVVVEKYFTAFRDLPGIEQSASINSKELNQLISDLKDSRLSLGSSEKFRSNITIRG